MAARTDAIIDTDIGYDGIDVQVVVVDLVAMLAQFYSTDDHARRLTPIAPPMPCRASAVVALERILQHRGYL